MIVSDIVLQKCHLDLGWVGALFLDRCDRTTEQLAPILEWTDLLVYAYSRKSYNEILRC